MSFSLTFLPRTLALGTVALLAILLSPVSSYAQTKLVTYYNFEDQNFVSDSATPAPLQTTTITTTFPAANGYSFPAGQGSTLNLAPGNAQTTNSSLRLDTDQGANNGDYIQFTVNSTALPNLSLSFATKTNGGFSTETLSYSTNGTTFTTVGTYTPTAAYTVATFNDIAGTSGQATLTFRITFSGAGGGNNKTTDIDNIQVKTPEPATTAAAILCLLGLGFHQRRRLAGLRGLLFPAGAPSS